MANNTNAPFGFKAVRSIDGSPFNNKIQLCFMKASDGTAVGINDLVKLVVSAADTLNFGVPCVTAVAANTDIIYGSIVGVEPVLGANPPNLYLQYRPASTAQYVYVVNATDTVFQVQLNGASAVTDIGKNASWHSGTLNTTNGLSAATLDSATINTTNTLQFQIIQLAPIPGNVIGNQFAIYEVILNVAQLGPSATGV